MTTSETTQKIVFKTVGQSGSWCPFTGILRPLRVEWQINKKNSGLANNLLNTGVFLTTNSWKPDLGFIYENIDLTEQLNSHISSSSRWLQWEITTAHQGCRKSWAGLPFASVDLMVGLKHHSPWVKQRSHKFRGNAMACLITIDW